MQDQSGDMSKLGKSLFTGEEEGEEGRATATSSLVFAPQASANQPKLFNIAPFSFQPMFFFLQPADNGAIYTCLGHHPTLDAPLKVLRYIHCNAMHCVQHLDESR